MKITLEDLQRLEGRKINETPSEAGNWLNLTLVKVEKGKAKVKMTIRPEMCNPYGKIHGGMMSLLIDEAIGWAVISLSAENNYTSLNLVVDFLYAANNGEEITAEATIIRHGKKIINCEVRVLNNSQVLLAKATSNLIVTSMNINYA